MKYYMDTELFDTEISVTNITNGYIELSTSRIYWNMIKKLRSLNSKSVILLILAASIISVIFTIQQSQQAQASNDCRYKPIPQDIACELGNAATGYDNGYSDGKNAGANGRSSSCPQSDSLSGYCLGWNDGWRDGADARRDMEQETGGNNNDNDNDNDNGRWDIINNVELADACS
jgi:hypothetical protein